MKIRLNIRVINNSLREVEEAIRSRRWELKKAKHSKMHCRELPYLVRKVDVARSTQVSLLHLFNANRRYMKINQKD